MHFSTTQNPSVRSLSRFWGRPQAENGREAARGAVKPRAALSHISWCACTAVLIPIRVLKYYLRIDPKERAPGGQHRTTPNAHPTAPWPVALGWGVNGDSLYAAFMPRLCVYGRLLAPPDMGAAIGGIGR